MLSPLIHIFLKLQNECQFHQFYLIYKYRYIIHDASNLFSKTPLES